MAIKFSQFTVRTSSSDLSHIVGYNGADNIQITPTNFLNSALTGTAGQVLFYDTTGVAGDNDLYWDNSNKRLGIGTTSPGRDLQVGDGSSNSAIAIVGSGSGISQLALGNSADDNYAQIILDNSNNKLQIQNGGGGTLTNRGITLDSSENVGIGTTSPSEKLEVVGNIKVGDSEQFIAGAGNDLKIYHNGVNSVIESDTGNLALINTADNRDILFQSDNGSGGTATYFFLDGQNTRTEFLKDVKFPDNVKANFGTSVDLQIWHDGSNSYISNEGVGNINIQNTADDKDIIFKSDNGSGGTVEYFRLDGANQRNIFSKNVGLGDNVLALFGNGNDMQLFHDGVQSQILNLTGNLRIRNFSDNSDITFESDDGSGGIATYFYLDGGGVLTRFDKRLRMSDAVSLQLGSSGNFEMYHFSGNTTIDNFTGNLTIRNSANDKDISFACDDGSGGLVEYFKLDGSLADGTNVFTKFVDNSWITMGNGGDLLIGHQVTSSKIENYTGPLYIVNKADDEDIIFQCDDGSGGVIEYLRLDGSTTKIQINREMQFFDNVVASFGFAADLKIYHDGSNSYIQDASGTGDIRIASNIVHLNNAASTEVMLKAIENGAVELYYDNVKKFETTSGGIVISGAAYVNDYLIHSGDTNTYLGYNGADSFELVVGGTQKITADSNAVYLRYQGAVKLETKSTGIKIAGVSEYADNTAAIAGGLTTGDVYRTGDLLKIVH